jgi:hypothetical protein
MGDILKEAIADAKAVRATALANAKMALEEAFTPQLKSMLSAKLKEDEFEDEEEEFGGEDEFGGEEEVPAEEGSYYEDDEIPGDDDSEVDINIDADGGGDMGGGEEDPFGGGEEDPFGGGEDDEEVEENIIELNGQSFKLVPISEDDEMGGEEEEEPVSLDLEAVIKELEDEINEEDESEEDAVEESDNPYDNDEQHQEYKTVSEGEESDDDKEEVDEASHDDDEEVEIDESLFNEDDEDDEEDKDDVEEGTTPSVSSGIGGGDNKAANDNSGPTQDPQGTKLTEVSAELKEYKEAVRFLKDKLHEVNILNAKLLFTNKLFREYALDNNQKLKVVETFDRTQSTREIKLVYSTLAEQFSDNGSIKNKKSIYESASSKSGSTKPSKHSRKVITEEGKVAERFKKLAGIISG